MKRRQLLIGIGGGAGVGSAFGAGAFSSAAAEREMTVTVADDAAGFLALRGTDAPNGAYADATGDQLRLAFGDDERGLSANAVYAFDRTFRVVNHGTQQLYVWTEVSSEAFDDDELYVFHDDRSTPFDASNAATVDVGEGRSLGVYVDTGDETGSYSADFTVYASTDPPNDTGNGSGGDGDGGNPDDGPNEPQPGDVVDPLVFDSTAGLRGASGALSDSGVVVAAESTATSVDEDGNGDATPYDDGQDVPLVARDGDVLAFGAPFGSNDTTFESYGNEEFLRNALEEYVGSGTVLWDEGHGQYYTLDGSNAGGSPGFTAFADYAEGFSFEATTDLAADLDAADAAVVTSPSDSFGTDAVDALDGFLADGGTLLLMDQSDYNDFDETATLNELAAALGIEIRFNDDQVVDEENNAGAPYVPVTENWNVDDYPALFEDRSGIGLDLDAAESYEVDVVSVTDGDTVDVEFGDGTVETVRTVGHDAPETDTHNERPAEWEGIDDRDVLVSWGEEATSFAESELADATVTLSFDEGEGLRGNYGRLLGFLHVDGDLFNERLIREGYARVYDSGLGRHDEFWSAEAEARANDRGLWSDSGVDATPPVRNDPVEELFFPEPAAVDTATGGIEDDRVVVRSESDDPLVCVDGDAQVALVGGPLVDEGFESEEGGPGVEPYGNEVFLTNLLDGLAADGRDGDVLIDGGHGQFAADYALSAEDAAYYQRYLEGQRIGFEGVNDVTSEYGPSLSDARALIITAPAEPFDDAEVDAISAFADSGGAVILATTGATGADGARENLDALADALGSDLRTGTPVTDDSNNLDGPENPTTTNFDDGDERFQPFGEGGESGDGGEGGSLTLEHVEYDPDGDWLQDEYVAFTNAGDSTLDLDGYQVSDEAGQRYTFGPLALDPGQTVRLYTGTGTDTDTERYWGKTGNAVWNNGGDTVTVTDPSGRTVIEEGYSG